MILIFRFSAFGSIVILKYTAVNNDRDDIPE